VLAAPVEVHSQPIGAYSLTTASPRTWSDHEVHAVLAGARVLGNLLQASATAHATSALAEQLQRALQCRTVIEQAKGALIERRGISAEEAFELLRTAARASRRRVVDVAADVLAGWTITTP
jgi:AmiR/NasT family two-component response regulator